MQKNCLEYPVEIVDDVFGETTTLYDMLVKACGGAKKPRVFIVGDSNVVVKVPGIGQKIGKYIKNHDIELLGNAMLLEGGEKIKNDNSSSANKVMKNMIDAQVGVNDCVLALGGGTLLDVVGYASAHVRGGIKVIKVPTTIGAMVDAAFATYAALDLPQEKDAIRVPSTPAGVVIAPSIALSVMDGVWGGGFTEMVRLALASDATLMKKIEKLADGYSKHEEAALTELVKATVASRMKKGDTQFGKWLANRLQTLGGYKLPHGYAMAMAICIEAGYAVEKGYLKETVLESVGALLAKCCALNGIVHSQHILEKTDEVLVGLKIDELVSGKVEVVLPTAVGKTMIETTIDPAVYAKVLGRLAAVPAQDQNFVPNSK